MIIGLTGTNASGKTSIVNLLSAKNFDSLSLSDVIRDELKKRSLPESRENLINIGNELRNQFGASVLADEIIKKIKVKNTVIDSIRNLAEIQSLKKLQDFFLLAVDAPVELRFKRAKARGRVENVSTLNDFIKIDHKESSHVNTHQNMTACMEQADYRIDNLGSIEQLHKSLEDILKQLQNRIRPSWQEYFLKMAFLVAERSTCRRHHVGAIIVKDRHVVTTGYNGAARNTDDCLKLGCLRDQLKIKSGERHEICRAIHAEQNAIIQAGVHGATIEGGTLYCTHTPCIICAKMIVNAGINKVVTCADYPDDFNLVIELFRQAEVEMIQIEAPDVAIKIKQ